MMTPAYKARVWRVGGKWHARRPVIASVGTKGTTYKVERRSFHLWRHALEWTAETRPRPADVAALVPLVGDTITTMAAAFKSLTFEVPSVQSDFKLAR